MEDGEILAVNGPPGTGKTTLLQSLVANLYVERALKKEDPPVDCKNFSIFHIVEMVQALPLRWRQRIFPAHLSDMLLHF